MHRHVGFAQKAVDCFGCAVGQKNQLTELSLKVEFFASKDFAVEIMSITVQQLSLRSSQPLSIAIADSDHGTATGRNVVENLLTGHIV